MHFLAWQDGQTLILGCDLGVNECTLEQDV